MSSINIAKRLGISLICGASMMMPNLASSAPGTLPRTPLFLTDAVEPNIFFTLDDSGSMEWELMVSDTVGLPTSSGLPVIGGLTRYYVLPTVANGQDGYYPNNYFPYTTPSTALVAQSWIARNHLANTLYYNPEITYEPWSGGSYTNATPSAAYVDPSNPGFGTIDLTKDISVTTYVNGSWKSDSGYPATYFEWIDVDTDGIVEFTDNAKAIEIKSGNTMPSGRSYTEEIQNFANWFQYYRKRSYVAKAAIGRVIEQTTNARMGLDIYNGGHQIDAATMTDPSKKADLYNTMYNRAMPCGIGKGDIYSGACPGTPARKSLDRVGNLFEGNTSNPTPILSQAKGGECQQNFNVLMSDGFWNGSQPDGIGNADKDGDTAFDGSPYADDYSVTLADVAMHYYEHDLDGSLANRVPIQTGVDEATHQHLVTYTIGFGLKTTLDSTSDPAEGGSNFWPDPTDQQDAHRVDDLWHAAYNARGQYLAAQDPGQLEKSLLAAIQDISTRTATAAAVAVNSARLTEKSVVYVAQFNSDGWLGELRAFPIANTNDGTLAATPSWEAGKNLDRRDISASGNPRQIITWDGSKGVAFNRNSASPTSTPPISSRMLADLSTNTSGGTDSLSVALARLDYLRGDSANESPSGLQFRPRKSLLGDIVNSGPVYVGEANLRWPDVAPFPDASGSRYSDFQQTVINRKKVVYVGSNSGMLHAFDDSTGDEVFAYVPNLISSTDTNGGYHYLTDPYYVHNWYVDLTPTISDIVLGGKWQTVLVGALRGGGRGLFALNVTDPGKIDETTAASAVLWEFTDNDLGFTYSRPAIALTNDNHWVAIFGNGYNDLGSGEATLYIVDIQTGAVKKKISTGVGSATDRNGLAEPALADVDGDGTVDYVYAGDLKGNLWVFDLNTTNASQWGVAYKGKPLFTTPANQPITAKPVLARHPTIPLEKNQNEPNLMVFFGSGQYLVDSDKSNTNVQSFYGVWDRGTDSLTRANLIQQTVSKSGAFRIITNNFVDYSTDYGWWFDLPDSGERSVTNSIARGTEVFFNTFVPETDPCSVGGYGWRMVVDMATGGSPKTAAVDINGDNTVNDDGSDDAPGGKVAGIEQEGFLPQPVFVEDLVFTGPQPLKVKPLENIPFGRFSWQELIK